MMELGLTSWEKPWTREGRTVSTVGKVCGNVSLIIITQMNLGCADTFLISFAFLLFLSLSFFPLRELNSITRSFFLQCPCINMYGRTLSERQRPWVDNEGLWRNWQGSDFLRVLCATYLTLKRCLSRVCWSTPVKIALGTIRRQSTGNWTRTLARARSVTLTKMSAVSNYG